MHEHWDSDVPDQVRPGQSMVRMSEEEYLRWEPRMRVKHDFGQLELTCSFLCRPADYQPILCVTRDNAKSTAWPRVIRLPSVQAFSADDAAARRAASATRRTSWRSGPANPAPAAERSDVAAANSCSAVTGRCSAASTSARTSSAAAMIGGLPISAMTVRHSLTDTRAGAYAARATAR